MADLEKKFSLYNSDGTESLVIEGSTEGIEKISGSSLVDTKAREDISKLGSGSIFVSAGVLSDAGVGNLSDLQNYIYNHYKEGDRIVAEPRLMGIDDSGALDPTSGILVIEVLYKYDLAIHCAYTFYSHEEGMPASIWKRVVYSTRNDTDKDFSVSKDNGWKTIENDGSSVDLSEYAKTTDVPTKLSQLTDDTDFVKSVYVPADVIIDESSKRLFLVNYSNVKLGNGIVLPSTSGSSDADAITIKDESNHFTSTNVEGALNELFQSVSNGKKLIATAITDKGITTSSDDTFQTMATNIGNISTGIEVEQYSWNQIPTLVKNFLDNVTYDSSDYTVSSIAEYAPASADVNNTYPIGQSIECTEGVLNRNGYSINTTQGNTLLYNDIPNKSTIYTINKDDLVSKVGILKPTGTLRQIKCITSNVRDLGGWNCDGGTVKYGKLFRGGYINPADSDIFLNQLGIKQELDLRGEEESKGATVSVLGNTIGYVCTKSYTWYSLINTEDWKTTFRCIFDSVALNKPLYFHCSAGADRTGTVACILEAILGVSQSDIDKDYELTCFASGTATDNQARRRNETDWKGLITQINQQPYEGSFRDKAIYWVLTLGFTLDEVNTFRHNMIDGTIEDVNIDVGTYSITYNLGDNINSTNTNTELTKYQPYIAEVSANDGYVMTDIMITMGGSNITSSVFTGEQTVLFHKVTTNLQHCSLNSIPSRVVEGKRFEVEVVPDIDYTLVDATVKITMGGVDVSAYYLDGKINIPKVTGDIVITIAAVKSENIEIFDITEATAYHNVANGGFIQITDGTCSIDSEGVFVSNGARNTYGIACFSNETLATLPAGDYTFKGEFKQSVNGASAIAIYNGGPTNRLLKQSLQTGDVWTPFEYEFSLTNPDVTSHIYFSGQQDGDGIGYLRNVQFILRHKVENSGENQLITPVVWNLNKGCSYTVGEKITQTDSTGYFCSNVVALNRDYNTCIMALSDVYAPTSFRVIGADNTGVITEVIGFDATTILAGSHTHVLEFANSNTTQFLIRGYVDSSIPSSTCKIIQREA